MLTRVILIRHGRTDASSRLCGWFDAPLTAGGRAQVRAVLAKPPARVAPDALYASTLSRAREVAEALGRAWSLEPRFAEWAREINCGDLDGMPLDQLQRQHPDLWARNEAQNDDAFAWPGGESYREFRARVLAGVRAIAAAHPGGRVAVVTHAGVISQVLGVIRSRPAAQWSPDRPDPFTATEVTWEDGVPRLVLSYNERDWF